MSSDLMHPKSSKHSIYTGRPLLMGIAKSSTHEYTWAIVHCHIAMLNSWGYTGLSEPYGRIHTVQDVLISASTSRRFLIDLLQPEQTIY
jgi:hypothetical protein